MYKSWLFSHDTSLLMLFQNLYFEQVATMLNCYNQLKNWRKKNAINAQYLWICEYNIVM